MPKLNPEMRVWLATVAGSGPVRRERACGVTWHRVPPGCLRKRIFGDPVVPSAEVAQGEVPQPEPTPSAKDAARTPGPVTAKAADPPIRSGGFGSTGVAKAEPVPAMAGTQAVREVGTPVSFHRSKLNVRPSGVPREMR